MPFNQRTQYLLLLILAALIFGSGVLYGRNTIEIEPVVAQAPPALSAAGEEPGPEILVYVTGAVSCPGVYRLPEGSRLVDAVDLAEATAEAALGQINLAAPLVDGQQVVVPLAAETGDQAVSSGVIQAPASPGASSKVNINTATVEELDKLPGIGPALAQRIIAYREENGPFRSAEDLQLVSGIGEKKYADLADLVTIY